MFDFVRHVGAVGLKVLLALCIAAAAVFIYVRPCPSQPAQLAPGYSPGFGRSSARYGDRRTVDPSSEQGGGNKSLRTVRD
jgi:hypothetical protein